MKWVDPRVGFTTPAPVYEVAPKPVPLVEQPDRMSWPDRQRIRLAAYRAAKAYPGPVGQLLHRELLAFEDFGVTISRDGLMMQVVEAVMSSTVDGSGRQG